MYCQACGAATAEECFMLHTLAAGSFKDKVNSAKNVICAKTKQSKESRPWKRLEIWRGFFKCETESG
jgi:hypothetical protein